jgi:hypothetical protein
VDGIESEHAAKAEQQSWLVVEISSTLAGLGMLPIQNTPQLSKSVQDVLMAASLLLERLQEAQASGAVPSD